MSQMQRNALDLDYHEHYCPKIRDRSCVASAVSEEPQSLILS
jgi:hypothetical protein